MNDEIYHYGIKGMKWGVRRFQRKDGSMTSADKKNYSEDRNNDNKKSQKKLSTGSKVAIGIGVSAAVATGAYFAHKYYKMNADDIIKAGKKFQHMGRAGEDLSKPFYASYLKRDNEIYAKNNFFGTNWKTQKELVAKKDIRIAGKKVTLDTFKEWVESSPIAQEKISPKNVSSKNIKRTYYKFNTNLNSPDIHDRELFDDFYSRLAAKGYDAIRDMNDQYNSGITSPVLIFNSLDDIMTTKVKDL